MALTSEQLCQVYSLADIELATENFNDGLVIGSGGFGKVYKGQINGERSSSTRVVAIKRLDSMSDQGAPEFRAEIDVVSKLRHAHLVSLLGCCDDGKEMILVYEYMPNRTLYHHLHNSNTPLSWIERLRIGIGAARGMDYLHTGVGTKHGVIHRDVKSSNILLDEDWAAKISDFGLAKLCPINQSSTYVHTGIKGTFGYLDPEIFMTGKFTRKTDVFAFGVVLFELLSGRRAVLPEGDEDLSLARWAQNCVKERKLDQIVAAEIRGTLSTKSLKEFVQIGYRCLNSDPKERPTMSEVVVTLQFSLALQEKFESCEKPTGIFGLTWKMPGYTFPPKKENSVDAAPSIEINSGSGKTASPLKIGSVHLTMRQVARATQNFSPSLTLGEGGFGAVYKGQLEDGQMVAIKRARKVHSQEDSDALRSEFRSEIESLAKIEHLNLVKLLGYVDKGNERLIITEYVPNGTLREHLDGIHGSCLDFSQRLAISIDIAHGLTYLHIYAEKQIIHRDVKSSNILLTDKIRAKVADFGFARVADTEPGEIHVLTKVKGTVGYLDPEYSRTYILTPKSDVYSFGVLLVEILTGRHPVDSKRSQDERITVRWALEKYNNGETMDLVDPQMKEAVDKKIFKEMLNLALQCVAPSQVDRPEMKSVAEQLWAIRVKYFKRVGRE